MRRRGHEHADERQLEGRYANWIEIGHNAFEFLLDFGQSYSADQDTLIHTRIIVSPGCIKNLMELLEKNIAMHEEIFGEIMTECDAE
jgi:hypothetical protein